MQLRFNDDACVAGTSTVPVVEILCEVCGQPCLEGNTVVLRLPGGELRAIHKVTCDAKNLHPWLELEDFLKLLQKGVARS